MFVKEIMIKDIVTIDANKSVYEAASLIREKKVGSVIVTNTEGNVGIVTKGDIIDGTILTRKNPETTPVSEIMKKNLVTVHPLENIQNAIELMEKNKIKKLLVINQERLLGVVTVTDISRATKTALKRAMNTYFLEENDVKY